MSPLHQAFQAYSKAQHTVSKTRQVVMLYDGMIRFLKQAEEAMRRKDIETRFNLLVRVSDIAIGLQGALDFEQGNEVAQTLYDFYSSVDARILAMHRTNDADACARLIGELKDMRDVWHAIDAGTESEDATRIVDANYEQSPLSTQTYNAASASSEILITADTIPQNFSA